MKVHIHMLILKIEYLILDILYLYLDIFQVLLWLEAPMTSSDCGGGWRGCVGGDTIDTLLVTEHGPACDWRLDLAPTHHLSSALHTSL